MDLLPNDVQLIIHRLHHRDKLIDVHDELMYKVSFYDGYGVVINWSFLKLPHDEHHLSMNYHRLNGNYLSSTPMSFIYPHKAVQKSLQQRLQRHKHIDHIQNIVNNIVLFISIFMYVYSNM